MIRIPACSRWEAASQSQLADRTPLLMTINIKLQPPEKAKIQTVGSRSSPEASDFFWLPLGEKEEAGDKCARTNCNGNRRRWRAERFEPHKWIWEMLAESTSEQDRERRSPSAVYYNQHFGWQQWDFKLFFSSLIWHLIRLKLLILWWMRSRVTADARKS